MNILTKALSRLRDNKSIESYSAKWPCVELSNWYAEIVKNPIIYRCIKLISQNIASIPIMVDEDADPFIKSALKRPNPSQDMHQLLQKIVSHMLVDGEVYLLHTMDDGECCIYAVEPQNVQQITNEFGLVTGYSYLTTKGQRVEKVQRDGYCKILHLKYANPFGTNESPCKVISNSVELYNAIVVHNQALMNHAARFSGALIVNGHMTQEQKQRLREEVDAKVGARNAGHVAILQGDIRWEAMKANVRDADYTEGQSAVVRTITSIFGVPPIMLGIMDAGFNHYREARLHFWEDTLMPLAKDIVMSLERWLNYYTSSPLNLRLDLKDIPAFAEKTHKRLISLAAVDFLSNEEKRQMCGL